MAGHQGFSEPLPADAKGAGLKKRKHTLTMLGIGLPAVLAVVGLLMHAVDRVREAADRAH
jgi:hypothetical protein